MSEPRISLAEIRATSERAVWVAPWQVLALVEAAQAAQMVTFVEDTYRDLPPNMRSLDAFKGPHREAMDKLRVALAPFTSETTNTLRAPSTREPLAPPKSTPGAGS